ncbi:cystathionine gamma-lyase [Streptococcus porcinus]|uniref:cystathionine beta-lyase n=1 Tax=Streptococcus porcinus TaxID=1340 RepID=UPI0010CAB864|nr:cystathionine beta-lyase [Streptococcus porcinus]VTS22708.1 cystathionine gamma-lyase [Streptococcus porcinus]
MIDYVALAIKMGGFTQLDKSYLETILKNLSHDQKLKVITPPPSVINAYFAEIYQKQSPKAATDYFFELSKAFELFQKQPSFLEEKPFIRLNLSGRSFGLAFENAKEVALVFSEGDQVISDDLLLELAQIFPHYVVFLEEGLIKMQTRPFPFENTKEIVLKDALLTKGTQSGQVILLSGYNAQEVISLSQEYQGNKYYAFQQKECQIYINQEKE